MNNKERKDLLIIALRTPSIVDRLLKDLDKVARDYQPTEYGLPTYNDAVMAQMRQVVYSWLLGYKNDA